MEVGGAWMLMDEARLEVGRARMLMDEAGGGGASLTLCAPLRGFRSLRS